MKISLRSFGSVISILLLIVLVRANSGSAPNAPGPPPSVPTFAGNAQHTAIYQPAAQNLNSIHWTTTIDLNPGDLAHYGSPVITSENTVLVPVKTATDGFQVNAFNGSTGAAKYTLTTDYVLPSHSWVPVYNPCLTTGSFGTRLYYAGRGGTIYYITSPDSAGHGPPVHQVFYTTLANYLANAAAYNATIFINTPMTSDSKGNVFFGFRVTGTAPAPLSTTQSGFARIDPNGNGTYVLAGTAANDATINRDSHNSAPALSNDETTLYVVAKNNTSGHGYLLALNSTTLAMSHRVFLTDPRNNNGAAISDDSTSSPTVAPDDDVYIGILSNPGNGSRGFLLRFSGDLSVEKTPGAFGWDYTPAIVPASMVPSYQGTSSYLIFSKYNNYAGFGDGDGVNRIALLDPNATQIDAHSSAPGLVEMREVLTVIGPTPDKNALSFEFPHAVREWCINTAAVNPATNSIFTPSEDGHIYRWNLATNSFTQAVRLTEGIGEPYVPTVIGPGGIVYTLNGGTLFALGSLNGVGVSLASTVPDVRTVVVGQSLTFTATITNTGPTGLIPSGTVDFRDVTYQDLTPVTTVLASNVLLDANGQASVTTSNLTAGNGFLGNHHITATYSGDSNFSGGAVTLVQKVHASASSAIVSSLPNPSSAGQVVTFTARVAAAPPGSTSPSGMVTFQESPTVLAQIPLNSDGTASFNTSILSGGAHTITALYSSDTVFASSSATTTHTVAGGPTPTATVTPSPTATPSEPCLENFDSVSAPALPIGWLAENPDPGDGTLWVTSIVTPDTAPNDAFIPAQDGISDKVLVTPNITVTSASEVVTFRNNFNTHEIFGDGGVLEVSSPNINGGAFTDIEAPAVGGWFISGGYTGTLRTPSGNPLAGRMAWSGNSDGYINTVVNLGPNVNGQTIKLRFRLGTDEAVAAPGWRIDTFYSAGLCGAPTPTPSPDPTPTPSPTPSPAAQATNLSTRMRVQTVDNVGIGGFIITGTSPKHVLLRAIGPSLKGFGVPDALADPVMELHGPAGFPTIINDNWRETQEVEIQNTGIPPTNDLESAIVVTLNPGAYTAIVRGKNNTSGVGLVEVYDLSQAGLAKLANISTRAFVGTGADVVIAGFILGGGGNTHILIRGVGPSLTAFGVPNALADPTLELRDSNGTLLDANDNCIILPPSAPHHGPLPNNACASFCSVGTLEACLDQSLPPGAFTAILAGKDSGTGVGLVEIYNLGEQ